MRALHTVYFVKRGEPVFDETTGNYNDSTSVRTRVDALVTDTGSKRMNLLYGKIRQKAKTVRLLQHYTAAFDYIEIDGQEYQIDSDRRYRTKHTFEVSGI